MSVNSLPKTVTRQRRDCDLNPGPTAPEFSTLIKRLPSHATYNTSIVSRRWLLAARSQGRGCPRLPGSRPDRRDV